MIVINVIPSGKQKTLALLVTCLLILSLAAAGCGSSRSGLAVARPLKVGVISGPHAVIMYAVKQAAEKDNLFIEVMEYTDYIQLNDMLDRGDIDANSYQPGPYLDGMIEDRKYQITAVAKTVILPLGLYSYKLKDLTNLPAQAVIAIPSDPINGSRALLLLEKAGLIKLRPGTGLRAATTDIVENAKNLQIRELDAAGIAQSLPEVHLAAINASYAVAAGLSPIRDAVLLEGPDSPYASVLAVQTKYKDDPAVTKLISAYHSDEVKQYILNHFQGLVLPLW